MKNRPVSRLLSAALICAALAACSFDERIADHAVDYNKTVEEAHNSLLLLNILRARDRRPMHFTAISQVRGKLTLRSTGSLNLQIPFGGDASNTFPLTPKLELSQTSNPDFSIAILDSKIFTSGILSPVEKSIFKFYLEQRWPPEVLLYLFIHKVDRTEPKPSLVNAPDPKRSVEFEKFQEWIEKNGNEIRFGTKETGLAIGPKLMLDEKSDLEHLVETEKAELRLVGIPKEKPSEYRLCQIVPELVLCVGECSKSNPEEDCRKENEPDSTQIENESQAKVLQDGKIRGNAHLRSVQGILYYLGEVLRYQEKGANNVAIKCKDKAKKTIDCREKDKVLEETVLFDLTTNKEEADSPIIGVEYGDKWYYVPKDKKVGNIKVRSRTKTVLALVSQLLGLHKASKELPTTTAVETVGGSP